MNIFKKIRNKLSVFDLALIFFILLQIAFLLYENATQIILTVDNDAAKSMVHAMEIWKNKSVHIPHWSAMTGLETGDPTIIAVLFYGIFNDIYKAYFVTNALLICLFIILFGRLCEIMNIKLTGALLSLSLLFIPYSFGQLLYANMLFFSVSSCAFRVLIPLLIVLLLNDDSSNIICYYILLLIACFMIYVNAISTGIYIFVTALVPALAVFVWMNIFRQKKLTFKQLLNRQYISFFAILLTFFAGIVTYYSLHFRSSGVDTQMLISSGNLLKSIGDVILGWLGILGSLPDTPQKLVSFSNLAYLLRLVIGTTSFVTIIVYCAKGIKALFNSDSTSSKDSATAMLIIVSSFTFLICILSGTGGSNRYLLPAIVASFIFVGDWLGNAIYSVNLSKIQGVILRTGIFVIFVLAGLFSNLTMVKGDCSPAQASYNQKLFVLKGILYKYPESQIVFLEDRASAEHLRLFDHDGEKVYLSYMVYGDEWNGTGIVVHDYYTNITDALAMGNENLLVINSELGTFDTLPNYLKECYSKIDEYDIFTIYRTDNNRMDGIIGYEENEHSRDYCYSDGYVIYSGELLNDGSLHSNGSNDYVIASPMLGDATGSINVTMNYRDSNKTSDTIGVLEVWDAHTHEKICDENINSGNKKVCINDISLKGKNLVVKVFLNEGYDIEIENFEYSF